MRRAYLLFLGLLLSLATEAVTQNLYCPPGFAKAGKKCEDENECGFEEAICGKNAVCYNTNGSYYCQCETGYQEPSGKVNFTQENSRGCKDIWECSEITDICGPNSECNNTIGSYFCTCKDGFVSSNGEKKFNASQGVTCDDINDCLDITDICGPNSECHNYIGSYFCTCKYGFVSSNRENKFHASQGVTCDDANECEPEQAVAVCGKNTVCYNIVGSYYCQCETGHWETSGKVNFTLNSNGCRDINECLEITDICGPNSEYINKRSEPTETCSPNSESHDITVSYFCTTKDEFILSNGEKLFNADHIKVAGFLFFFSVIHCFL